MPYGSPLPPTTLIEHDLEHFRTIHRRLRSSPDLSPHSEIVSDTLSALALLFTDHFSRKEQLLTTQGADAEQLAFSRTRHNDLLRRYVSLCEGATLGRKTVVGELLELLECCLVHHEPEGKPGVAM